MNWRDNTPMSRWSIVFAAGFVACSLLTALLGVGSLLVAMVFFVLCLISANLDTRRHQRKRASHDAQNAARFGTALGGSPPPLHVDQLASDDIADVFDLITGDLLGQLSGVQLRQLVMAYQASDPETNDEENDLHVFADDAESLESRLDPATMTFVRNAFRGRDELELRWVPRSWLTAAQAGVASTATGSMRAERPVAGCTEGTER